MKKRILSLMLAACIIFGMLPFQASAEETVESTETTAPEAVVTEETLVSKETTVPQDAVPKDAEPAETIPQTEQTFQSHAIADETHCGDAVYWKLENGTLTIYGEGPMYDFESRGDAPWYNYSSEITSIVITNGVTHIGQYAFYSFTKLSSVDFGSTLTSIGKYAFAFTRLFYTSKGILTNLPGVTFVCFKKNFVK